MLQTKGDVIKRLPRDGTSGPVYSERQTIPGNANSGSQLCHKRWDFVPQPVFWGGGNSEFRTFNSQAAVLHLNTRISQKTVKIPSVPV